MAAHMGNPPWPDTLTVPVRLNIMRGASPSPAAHPGGSSCRSCSQGIPASGVGLAVISGSGPVALTKPSMAVKWSVPEAVSLIEVKVCPGWPSRLLKNYWGRSTSSWGQDKRNNH